MSSFTAAARLGPESVEHREIARGRAQKITLAAAIASGVLLVDLVVANHTAGEEVWGPITAASGAAVGALSLAFLMRRGRSRVARFALYGLWGMVAFFGVGGYNDHRLPVPADVADSRPRPPLAPLVFTGLGICGALVLRYGTKEH